MIKKIIFILLLQGAIAPCNSLLAQKNSRFFQSDFFRKVLNGDNRFSIQTGLFHQFFDGSPVINPERMHENRTFVKDPLNAWGGRLNDSWGWTYRRKVNEKSAIQFEWMKYSGNYIGLFTEWKGPPRVNGRGRKKYSLTYFRLVPVNKKVEFNIGIGASYQWGFEIYSLMPNPPYFYDFYDKLFIGGMRKDLGFNLKSGFDYTPIKQLTLSAGVSWNRSVFLETKSHKGVDINEFFVEKYGMTQFPSKGDLSFNLSVGFNF